MSKKPLITALSVLALAVPTVAQAAEPTGAARFTRIDQAVDSRVLPRSMQDDARVSVIVELSGDPVAVVQAKAGRKLSDAEKSSIRASLKAKQDAIKTDIAAKGGTIVGQMQSAYNGVQVSVSRQNAAALASLPGVVAVHAVTQQTPDNSVSVPYLGVPAVWQNTGYTGKGVKVGIIDTGIDYTHADFGGPGTTAAYDSANATDTVPANPALFGPAAPRVKGGYDLAGDNYDATGKKGSTTPTPDPNPLDCADAGHGTHVAGSAVGGGVTADGLAYTGPYDSATAGKEWKVGPGVAPEADLYSYRVFGCFGSTDLTTMAIDRAVADGMNVINMSLGSPFGLPDDASAVAASNAVGAGVVVVASAGNSGPNPYLVGSPSVGSGVISVAAMDSTKDFPGAVITLPDGAGTVQAINANGYTPLPTQPLTVVVLKDDPATAENEALGCSVAAYTKAGVTAGANQIAVSTRGTCARVAKAIFAQQAGAAAALMINTSTSYPPFEGAITSNPDDGVDYTVTIPFLGVRSTDGAKIKAAEGKTVTLASNRLANPTYTGYADFTSGGPRTYDSGLKPSVTAPGVSIVSALVASGTGSEVLSGTSMAAPEVAGVAALTAQAHPGWSAQDQAAAIVTTSDAAKNAGYRLTLGGEGQVDAAQSVATKTVLLGDQFTTASGVTLREPTLSFGFAGFSSSFSATKDLVIKNNGTSSATYALTSVATPQSKAGSVSISPSSVVVPAGSSATVKVTLSVAPSAIPSSEGAGFRFFEVSGSIVATAGDGSMLNAPYLLVPRAQSKAAVTVNGRINDRTDGVTVTFTNKGGGITAGLDVYAWGISDKKDLPANAVTAGMDLRAAGVQAFPTDDTLVFAVNNWTRFSNAAVNEYDVLIDTNGDGAPDFVVLSADLGAVTTGNYNGKAATFLYDVATKSMSAYAYTVAPTDSSTVLMPMSISALGLTPGAGAFRYTVMNYTAQDGSVVDQPTAWATYNPFMAPVVGEGQYGMVAPGQTVTMTLPINKTAYKAFVPLGAMIVAFDNAAGADEALLIEGNR